MPDHPSNVFVHGFIPRGLLGSHIAALECGLVPSRTEGAHGSLHAFPMKVFDYMAHGIAIVASDIAPVREVLDDTTSIILPPTDLDAWALALRALASDPQRRRAMGAEARRVFEAGYTWRHRAEALLALGVS